MRAGTRYVYDMMAYVHDSIENAVNDDGQDKSVLERFVNEAKDVVERGKQMRTRVIEAV